MAIESEGKGNHFLCFVQVNRQTICFKRTKKLTIKDYRSRFSFSGNRVWSSMVLKHYYTCLFLLCSIPNFSHSIVKLNDQFEWSS